MTTIDITKDTPEMAIINATITAVAQYVGTKHQIPLTSVVSGMSMGNHIIPAVQISLAAHQDRMLQAAKAASDAAQYIAPPVTQPPPQPAPAPVPVRPEPAQELPPHPVYGMAGATLVTTGRPEAIPSAFTPAPEYTPPPPAPAQTAPVQVAEEQAPAPAKKRGRPKKTA